VIETAFDEVGLVNEPEGEFGQGKLAEGLVKLGLRAQLRSSSLLTGQLLVAFDFFPDAPPAEITRTDDGLMQFPTVPSTMEDLERSVGLILDKISALPLDQITGDLRNTPWRRPAAPAKHRHPKRHPDHQPSPDQRGGRHRL
jgi:paraquat-inducible protein B